MTPTADWDSVGVLRLFQKVPGGIQPENQNPQRPFAFARGYPSPPRYFQPARNRGRVARAECARMECRVRYERVLDGRLWASMLLMVGGRPKTARLTVLRLILADRDTLCHHDMSVPTE